MFIIFDTETSGLFNFGQPLDAEGQPRLASIAFIMLSETFAPLGEHYKLVYPDGWQMSYGASMVNGLNQQMLLSKGIPVRNILDAFQFLLEETPSHTFVGHNIDFDLKIMASEFIRDGRKPFETPKTFCTMRQTKNICRIPDKRGRNKWPKLTEAYEFFFGESFTGAHEALGDARATSRLFQHVYANGLYEEAA